MFIFLIMIIGILLTIMGLFTNPIKTISTILIFVFLYSVAENTHSFGLAGALIGIFSFILFIVLATSDI